MAGKTGLGLLGAAYLLTGCSAILFHPREKDAAPTCSEPATDSSVPSGSGNRLRLRHYHAESPRGLVVYFYGNSKNLSYRCDDFSWLVARGFDLVLFDYSGYGPSEGRPALATLREDGVSVMRFVRDSLRPPATVYLGTSMGGAILLSAYSHWQDRPDSGTLILDSTFPSFRAVGAHMIAKTIIGLPFFFLPYLCLRREDEPDHLLVNLRSTRALVAHCREDHAIPFSQGLRLFSEYPGPKTFWDLGDCGHSRGFDSKSPGNREKLIEYLGKESGGARLDRSRGRDAGRLP